MHRSHHYLFILTNRVAVSDIFQLGASYDVSVKPVCMTFEDYYAAFSPDSHPSLSVSPAIGRMDRRGGEATIMTVRCEPEGASGKLEGNLVINLPEDNSKICYKVIVSSF